MVGTRPRGPSGAPPAVAALVRGALGSPGPAGGAARRADGRTPSHAPCTRRTPFLVLVLVHVLVLAPGENDPGVMDDKRDLYAYTHIYVHSYIIIVILQTKNIYTLSDTKVT